MCLFVIVLAVLAVAWWFPFPNDAWSATWQSGFSRLLFLTLILGALCLLSKWQRHSWQGNALGGLLLILIALDALTHTPRQNPTVNIEAYGPMELKMSSRPHAGAARAMISRDMQAFLDQAANPDPLEHYGGQRRSLFANCNLLEDLPKVNGFYSLYLKEEAEVRALLDSSTNAFVPAIADFLGVSQISSPTTLFEWVERRTFMPLATAGQAPIFAEPNATLNGMAQFDPRQSVYLPAEARNYVTVSNRSQVQIHAQRFGAHQGLWDVEAEAPALVVFAQTFYHSWKASVDGVPTRLWRANHAFQAVEIPAGRHQLELIYRDTSFYFGAVISGITILGCAIAWLWGRKTGCRLTP